MENVGILPNGEWNSFTGMFSTEEETNFMAQLLGNYPFPSEQDEGSSLGTPSTFWPCHEATINMAVGDDSNSYYSLDTLNSNAYYFSQGSSYSSGSHFFPTSGHESYYLSEANPILVTNNSSVPIDMFMVDEKNSSVSIQVFPDNLMEEIVCMNDEMSSGDLGVYGGNQSEATILPDTKLHLKRKSEMPKLEMATEDKNNTNSSENPKKKSRISGDVQKNKKNVQLKKNKKLVPTSSGEEEGNVGGNRQSSSSYCSEDDSNASQELNGGTTSTSKGSAAQNLDGKRRASRGSATDPQSLYARKRRERINERLRILQNLVPNGTKVDISTMLEEAVQYVKFLQLQIKLLSSDDLWMYAPIACNGVNIGLDLEISPLQ